MPRKLLLALLFLLSGRASAQLNAVGTTSPPRGDFGVLVMAHGGTPEWNAEVRAAVEPIRRRYAVEVALGMAEAGPIQEAVRRLEAQGVTHIGVVRLFVSGESWYERTEQILGLVPGAPNEVPSSSGANGSAHATHGGHAAGAPDPTFWRVETRATFALSTTGLADAEEMGAVLADRARSLSRAPQREDVLIIAHGPGDERENARWLKEIDARANAVREALPFRRVQVETLREDWPDKRRESERRIRALVDSARAEGYATIVLPFRVQGFGPYADVLRGLDYVADGRGLLPHVAVSQWIARQAELLRVATPRVASPFRAPPAASH